MEGNICEFLVFLDALLTAELHAFVKEQRTFCGLLRRTAAGKDFVQLYTCSKATETIDCPVFLKWQKAALFGGRPNIFYYPTGNLNGHLFYLCPFLKSLHRKSPCKCTDLLNRKPHKIFWQTPAHSFRPVSNWGPFACEANVITTTLRKPVFSLQTEIFW